MSLLGLELLDVLLAKDFCFALLVRLLSLVKDSMSP